MRRLALVLALVCASGCLGAGAVRTAIVEEHIELDARAPASARERVQPITGCVPGVYDPDARTLRLAPRDSTPHFAIVVRAAEGNAVLTAGGRGLFDVDLGILEDEGHSGSWGFSSPFRDLRDVATFRWDRTGPTFDGVPLEIGKPTPFGYEYETSWDNVTFGVKHRFDVTYLGRVPYDASHVCAST